MSSGLSQKDIAKSVKTLLVLLQSLRGKTVTINLRDDSLVHGTVDRVDGRMNFEMANVVISRDTFYDTIPLQDQQVTMNKRYDYYFVKGPRVRHIELPQNCDDMEQIKDEINRIRRRRLQWTKKDVVASKKLEVKESS